MSDIKKKVIKITYSLYEWIDTFEIKEDTTIKELDIEMEIELLSLALEQEFDINYISPDDISKWKTIKDIVVYIRDTLERALHDMEKKR